MPGRNLFSFERRSGRICGETQHECHVGDVPARMSMRRALLTNPMLTERRETRHDRVGIVLLCIVLCSSSGVAAQEPPPEGPPEAPIRSGRPFRAIFGDARAEPELSRGVDFTGSVSGVYDENLLADFGVVAPSTALDTSGKYTNFEGDLRFVRRGSRLQVAGTGGVNSRYYGSPIAKFIAADYHTAFGMSARMSPFTTLEVNQTLSYSPVLLLGLFATAEPPLLGEAPPPATDYAVTDDRALNGNSSVRVERGLSDRALVSFVGAFRRSHYLVASPNGTEVASPNGTDFTSVDAGALYRYRLVEDGDLVFGYTYRRARYSRAEPVTTTLTPDEHVVLAGLEFHPMLSDARRTVLTFQAGTSLVQAPSASNVFVIGRQLRLIGDVSLLHQMGRTWLLTGAFERGTAFVEGLSAPVFTDAISISTSGFVNDRTDLLASLSYSNGVPSLVTTAPTFATTTANVRVRVLLSSRWAFTSEYLYYFYDFSKTPQLAPELAPRARRNSVRAGLALWLPLHRP